MLKVLRKNMKIILWLLLATFVLWGVGSGLGSKNRSAQYAGTVFGRKVSLAEFAKAWEGTKNQAILMYGDAFSTMVRTMDLNSEVWTRIILLTQARRQRIKVSPNEVVSIIAQIPIFQQNARFDNTTYKRMLEYYFKTTPQDFEESVRDTLMIEKLQQSIMRDVSVTPEEIRREYEKTYQKTIASYVLIKTSEFGPDIQVSEAQLMEYYNKYLPAFKKQGQVNVLYLGPLDEKKANAIEDKLMENQDISIVAKEAGLELKETGYFQKDDEIKDIGSSQELSFEAFDLPKDQVSKPIKTEKGFYIIKKIDHKAPYTMPYEEAKDKIRQLLVDELATKKANEYAQNTLLKLTESLKQPGATFESCASQLSLSVVKTEPFSINDEIKGIGQSREMHDAVFGLKVGQISGLVPTSKGFVILRVDEVSPIDEEKFKNDKDEFAKAFLKKKRLVRYLTWYATLAKQADLRSNIGEKE